MADVAEKGTRVTKCERVFVDADGKEAARSHPTVVAVRLRFTETGDVLDMPLADLNPGIINAAAAFGLNTSVGNTFGAISDPGEAFEAAETRWNSLREGHWSAERQSGPRTSDILEAVARYRKENGSDVSDAWREGFKAKLADGQLDTKKLLEQPVLKAHYLAIKRERAEERATKAAAAVGASKPSAEVEALLD